MNIAYLICHGLLLCKLQADILSLRSLLQQLGIHLSDLLLCILQFLLCLHEIGMSCYEGALGSHASLVHLLAATDINRCQYSSHIENKKPISAEQYDDPKAGHLHFHIPILYLLLQVMHKLEVFFPLCLQLLLLLLLLLGFS